MKRPQNIRKTIERMSMLTPAASPGFRRRLSTTIPVEYYRMQTRRKRPYSYAVAIVLGLLFLAVIWEIDLTAVLKKVQSPDDGFRPTRVVTMQPGANDPNYFKPTQVVYLD